MLVKVVNTLLLLGRKRYFHVASMKLNNLEGEFVLLHDCCLKSAA